MQKKIALFLTVFILALFVIAPTAQAATLLKVGSSGQEVATLQSNLNKLGYNSGSVDGIFGSKTKAAVQAFQRNSALQADGIVGPLTNSALSKALNSNTKTTTTSRAATTKGIIDTAKALSGTPYLWGGTTTKAFDCSGYTQYVYAKNGITLPRVSRDQFKVGTSVNFNSLAPGDLVFFSLEGDGQVDHVGIYLGDNQFISATTSKGVTTYSFTPYWKNGYVGAKRVY